MIVVVKLEARDAFRLIGGEDNHYNVTFPDFEALFNHYVNNGEGLEVFDINVWLTTWNWFDNTDEAMLYFEEWGEEYDSIENAPIVKSSSGACWGKVI